MPTLFTGQNRIELSESPSVNTHAMELLRGVNLPEGTLIFTHHQSAGRGQRGAKWLSESGKNLTLCVIFKPHFLKPAKSFPLSMTVSLALADLVSDVLSETEAGSGSGQGVAGRVSPNIPVMPKAVFAQVSVKWPNDVYVGGKKIAGILIENVIRDEQWQAAVCGIGFNVNQLDFGELNGIAVSLARICGRQFELNEVMDRMMEKLEARYLQLRAGKIEQIKDAYEERLLYRGQLRKFRLPGGAELEGEIEGVNEDGKLILKKSGGGSLIFDFKEIIF